VSLQLHRPDGKGGIEPRNASERNWRRQLRSPRWGAALPGGRLPAMKNPEMNPTRTSLAVLFWLSLGILTFVLILLGYGTGFWTFQSSG
jgi:hypothetical protein